MYGGGQGKVLAGISSSSTGSACAEPYMPSLNIKVTSYISWLLAKMDELDRMRLISSIRFQVISNIAKVTQGFGDREAESL